MRKRWIALGLLALAAAGVGFYFNGELAKEKEASSPTAVEAIERVRDDYLDYVVHEEAVDGGKVVFYLHYHDNGFVLQADYAKKTRYGWKYVFGGGFGGSGMERQEGAQPMPEDPDRAKESYLNLLHMYIPSTVGTEFGRTPFPMYMGAILDPEVTSVVVTSVEDGLEKQAKIVTVDDYFRIYFVFLDESQGLKLKVTTYDGDGRKLQEVERDESASHGFESGTQASASPASVPSST
ncbi:hypothetical protein [Cohnella thailandensis]|uniref:Uncharacterized protein n=1 Tax=Cohnella thailandensis TaxID=557557 RepID=A0A841SXJ3_9BACL|nr:hypothetical protein [Cohnella thailandensis]MBB6634898.1 hypothetical protein [Cohnella thailandensis]MBP1975880.1 hypothetical protein [Cohnella thailandensis]